MLNKSVGGNEWLWNSKSIRTIFDLNLKIEKL
jgi:hypothetical protein